MGGTGVDLFWLPLGAGGHFVRANGRIYEAVAARLRHRDRNDLYHSALEVHHAGERYVIEQGPVWNVKEADRGVVREGPAGSPRLCPTETRPRPLPSSEPASVLRRVSRSSG